MALHSRGGCHATTRRLQQYGRPYQPKHSPSYSSHFDFVRARPVICHSAVRLLLLSISIGPCRWPSLRFSSAFLRSLFTHSSHLSCGLPRFLQPSCCFVSDLFGNLSRLSFRPCVQPIVPTIQALVLSSLRSFVLLLSTLFTPAILLILWFSHTRSLRCCCSDRPTVSKPYILQ